MHLIIYQWVIPLSYQHCLFHCFLYSLVFNSCFYMYDSSWKIYANASCSESHSVMPDSLQLHGLYRPWNSPGQNTGVGSCSLLQDSWNSPGQDTGASSQSLSQGIFPTQGLNPGPPHCRQILNQLSHQGNPKIQEWVASPFSSRSSWPRNQTRVSCTAGGFFTSWAIREPQ